MSREIPLKKVLVTGAAGQLGSILVRRLLDENVQVSGTVLPQDPCALRLDGLDIELREGDLLDREFVHAAVEGVDAVLHTANLVGEGHFEHNTKVTFNVAKACADHADALHRLVYVSSSSVYPNDSQCTACAYHPVDERHPRRPIDDYGLGKVVGEHTLAMFARTTNLRTTVIRPTGLVSGDAVLSRWSVGFVCGILRTGQQYRNSELYLGEGAEPWADLENMADSPDQPCAVTGPNGEPWQYQVVDGCDVAHAMVRALGSDDAVGEAFNISAPEPIRFPQAARLLSEMTGKPLVTFQAPVRWVYDLDHTKARTRIGFRPEWDIRRMLGDALSR